MYSFYREELIRANKNGFQEVLNFISFNPPSSTRELLILDRLASDEIKNTDEYKNIINNQAKAIIDKIIKALDKNEYMETSTTKFIVKFSHLITIKDRKKILHNLLKYTFRNTSYKKSILSVVVDWISSEDEAIKFVLAFNRILRPEDLNKLSSKITNGLEHESIRDVFKKRINYKAIKFSNLDLQNTESRAEFINNIAFTPSLIKKVNFNLHLTYNDLKEIPPCRRFKFIKALYYRSLYYIYSVNLGFLEDDLSLVTHVLSRMNNSSNHWSTKISIDPISIEEMNSLLFSVAIRKNDDMVDFINKYKIYLNRKQKIRRKLDKLLEILV
jgi:hypothetical protein